MRDTVVTPGWGSTKQWMNGRLHSLPSRQHRGSVHQAATSSSPEATGTRSGVVPEWGAVVGCARDHQLSKESSWCSNSRSST